MRKTGYLTSIVAAVALGCAGGGDGGGSVVISPVAHSSDGAFVVLPAPGASDGGGGGLTPPSGGENQGRPERPGAGEGGGAGAGGEQPSPELPGDPTPPSEKDPELPGEQPGNPGEPELPGEKDPQLPPSGGGSTPPPGGGSITPPGGGGSITPPGGLVPSPGGQTPTPPSEKDPGHTETPQPQPPLPGGKEPGGEEKDPGDTGKEPTNPGEKPSPEPVPSPDPQPGDKEPGEVPPPAPSPVEPTDPAPGKNPPPDPVDPDPVEPPPPPPIVSPVDPSKHWYRSVAPKLYSAAALDAADGARVAAETPPAITDLDEQPEFLRVTFPTGWAGDYANAHVVAAIMDSGLPKERQESGFGGYFAATNEKGVVDYDLRAYPLALGSQLDLANLRDGGAIKLLFRCTRSHLENGKVVSQEEIVCPQDRTIVHKDYESELTRENDGVKLGTHGTEVSYTVLTQLAKSKFVNLKTADLNAGPCPNKQKTCPRIDKDFANDWIMVPHASGKGVRFFNRSQGSMSNTLISNPGKYEAAIMYHNALVINSAGNDPHYEHNFTQNALAPDSPLRKGWIIVTGYGYLSEAEAHIDVHERHLNTPRDKKYTLHIDDKTSYQIAAWGHPCRQIGWQDCISAPFFVYDSAGKRTQGTSFSAPLVTSVAMGVYAKFPWMSNENIKETLFTTAYKITGAPEQELREHFGVGAVNPAGAMHGPGAFRKDFAADVSEGLFVFSNPISGAGGLRKSGPGTLALRAANTFTGASEITDGELWLLGANAADFTNSARLRMGAGSSAGQIENSGTIISEGFSAKSLVLAPSSKLAIKIGEEIKITGAAALDGELAITGRAAGYVATGAKQSAQVLSARSVSGTFERLSSASAFITPSKVAYTGTAASVEFVAQNNPDGLPEAQNFARWFEHFDYLADAAAKNPQSAPPGLPEEDLAKYAQMIGGENKCDPSGKCVKVASADFAVAGSAAGEPTGDEMAVTEQKSSALTPPRDGENTQRPERPAEQGGEPTGGGEAVTEQKSSALSAEQGGEAATNAAALTPPRTAENTQRPESSRALRFAAQVQQLSAEQARALAPALFGAASAPALAARSLAAAELFDAPANFAGVGLSGFYARTKALSERRNLSATLLSAGSKLADADGVELSGSISGALANGDMKMLRAAVRAQSGALQSTATAAVFGQKDRGHATALEIAAQAGKALYFGASAQFWHHRLSEYDEGIARVHAAHYRYSQAAAKLGAKGSWGHFSAGVEGEYRRNFGAGATINGSTEGAPWQQPSRLAAAHEGGARLHAAYASGGLKISASARARAGQKFAASSYFMGINYQF